MDRAESDRARYAGAELKVLYRPEMVRPGAR